MAKSDTVETYRSLRETIKHAAGESLVRTVLIVDIDREEPSPVALELARAFGAAGDRCALIDTNLRQTNGLEPGLAELMADSSFDLAMLPVADGLTVMGPGGAGNPDLLSTPAFREALASVRESFDYAILTCDAFPATGDAIAIAPEVDAAILVISAGVTRREPAIQARDALERVGARILGMVMIERPRRWF